MIDVKNISLLNIYAPCGFRLFDKERRKIVYSRNIIFAQRNTPENNITRINLTQNGEQEEQEDREEGIKSELEDNEDI